MFPVSKYPARFLILLFVFLLGTLAAFSQSTPFFAVTGTAKQPDGSLAATGLKVIVRNTSRQLQIPTELGTAKDGEYKVLFFNNGKIVAKVGDTFKVSIIDGDDNIVVFARQAVTKTEIDAGRATIDLQILLSEVELSPSNSILTPPAIPPVANGKDAAIVRVELKDTQNKPIVGQKFLVTATGSDNTILEIQPTNIHGQSRIEVSTTKAEKKTLTVKLGEVELKPVEIAFVADAPDPDLSTITAAAGVVVANGKEKVEIAAKLIDANNNPVVGKKIGVISSGSDEQTSVPALSDGEGKIIAYLTSTKAEKKTLTIIEPSSGIELSLRPVVTFVHGLAHQTRSAITADTPTLADGKAKSIVTVTVLDQYGNPVEGTEVTITVSGSENILEQSIVPTNVQGKAIANVSSTKAERKIITAKADHLPLAATTEIDFLATFLDQTTIEIVPLTLPADGHSTATITVATADPNGNRITDRVPQLVVTGQGKLGEPELDNQNKVWLASYIADRKPGTAVISVLIDNTIKASTSIVLSQPDPNSQLIDEVSALPKAVMTGEQLIFHLVGTTGGQARVSVAGLFNDLPMSETNLGVYSATYSVKETDKVAEAVVTFKLGDLVNKTQRISVNLKGVPTILEFIGENTARLGATRSIQGEIKPSIANLPIVVVLTPPDGSALQEKTVTTDQTGRFSVEQTFDLPGGWLIEASYAGSDAYLPASQSTVFITTLDRGKAVIVVGGDSTVPPVFEQIAESVLDTFAKRRLDPDNDIRLLTPNSTTDQATAKRLQESITEWAAPKVGAQSPLFIYLISPNLDRPFLLADQTPLTPDLLAGWLSVVAAETPTFIFVEASHSGNFITQWSEGKPALSTLNRVVVTSTHADRQTRIRPNQASFSTAFFDQIQKNRPVAEAFIHAQRLMRVSRIHQHQLPQIDTNGNGIPNEAKDLEQVSQLLIPTDTELQMIKENPLRWATESKTLSADQQSIQIRVTADADSLTASSKVEIEQVWATIVPPSFEAQKSLESWDQLNFDRIELIPNQSERAYSKMYAKFREAGRYLIFVHAIDQDGGTYTDLPPIEIGRRLRVDPQKPTVLLNLCADVACDAQIEQGSVFDLLIQVQNIGGLLGFEVTLKYNPNNLSVLSVSEGEFLKRLDADTFVPTKPLTGDHANQAGRISLGVTRLGTSGMSGAGTLGKVQFQAKKSGKTTISFQETNFSDADAEPIAVNLVDATVHIGFTLPSWDVNKDGKINIFDLVIAANQFSQSGENMLGDVNQDQVVNIFDIVLIGSHFGEEAGGNNSLLAAPSHLSLNQQIDELFTTGLIEPNGTMRQRLLEMQRQLSSLTLQIDGVSKTRAILNGLITGLNTVVPQQTQLLQNYPNPFNPETWIPFELTESQSIQIAIYSADGDLVRSLSLRELPAGSYLTPDRAAYWDGQDQNGRRVSSGIYFYQLQSDGLLGSKLSPLSNPRKMIIVK